ncbi:DUF4270 family protein [Arenibacter sp. M-2]|uniref:DUF4270 domain-containing protein n=1 Tax=unclassified Arenibacter TaxID=2615047 RepID=UPI000D759B61|nr:MULTISPECIES: DUF4270 domain-containing protein [unclassified Arenibacter]MDL5512954.1 DUF4270 family protein [Arenibacter sp. M-2]PXX31499.1 uncharacterized protein DUF4270 [Arenibacter sp. ARW7G5Y1]|tara:strand:- start:26730 stop:28568 length:1839 start_codon:yes stop_codon:yes gene_type:complete
MNLLNRLKLPTVVGILLVVVLWSCEEDLTTVGSGVVGGEPFTAGKAVYDVFAYNKKIEAVRTNKLPVYQIGNYTDPIYGKTEASITTQVQLSAANPTFGSYSAQVEETADTDSSTLTIKENETVKEVFLFIPFLTNPKGDRDLDGVADEYDADPEDANSDSDGDTLTDIQEKALGTDPLNRDTDGDGTNDNLDDDTAVNRFPIKYDLDSIFDANGAIPESFNLKVERSTYFLRDLDPNTNFQEAQQYYSSQQFSPGFVSDLLYEGPVEISNVEELIFKEDDPETEDVDESEEAPVRIAPGIRVQLNSSFFQQNILDKEGSSELLSQANFAEFFRGVHMSIPDDVLVMLDLTQGNITIKYEYDSVTSSTDATVIQNEREFVLNFIRRDTSTGAVIGNAVNTFINEAYPTEISNGLDNSENASKIYLKGGAGSYAQIKLFDEVNGSEIINQIKNRNWIINEANLVFYVDRNSLDAAGGTIEPSKLYLYKDNTNGPVYNQFLESEEDFNDGNITNYDGSLKKEGGKGQSYKIKITNYINDLIVRDSTNATLNLALTSDIRITATGKAMLANSTEGEVPVMSSVNPFGTVLYGSDNLPSGQEGKKLKLEIFYTKAN